MILIFIVGYAAGAIVMAYIEWVTVHNTGKSIFRQRIIKTEKGNDALLFSARYI